MDNVLMASRVINMSCNLVIVQYINGFPSRLLERINRLSLAERPMFQPHSDHRLFMIISTFHLVRYRFPPLFYLLVPLTAH